MKTALRYVMGTKLPTGRIQGKGNNFKNVTVVNINLN